MVGGSYLTVQSRRRSLVVYNVEPEHFESLLGEVFDHLRRTVERRGNLWVGGVPLCEVDPFAGGRTVTLRWLSEDLLLFQEVERQVREAVRMITTRDNPAARWFSSAVAGTTLILVFLVFVILYLMRKL